MEPLIHQQIRLLLKLKWRNYLVKLSILVLLQIESNLNDEERSIIQNYLQAIKNTGFVKNDDMLPQSAQGFAYYFDAQKNWNIVGSHYLHLLS